MIKMKRKYCVRLETSEFDICLTDAYGYGEGGIPNGNSYGFGNWVGDGDGCGDGADLHGDGCGGGWGIYGIGAGSFIIEDEEDEVNDSNE